MTEAGRPTVFADLMAKLGYFLFYWSLLEAGLPKSIQDMRKQFGEQEADLPPGLAKRLDIWRDLAERDRHHRDAAGLAAEVCTQALALRDIRNTVVHGLCGGNARPKSGRPYIACIAGGSEDPSQRIVRYSLDDLEHFIQAIDSCVRAFIHLPNFNYRLGQPP